MTSRPRGEADDQPTCATWTSFVAGLLGGSIDGDMTGRPASSPATAETVFSSIALFTVVSGEPIRTAASARVNSFVQPHGKNQDR